MRNPLLALGVLLALAPASHAALRFDPPGFYPHPGNPGEIAVGDFNGDSHRDFLVIIAPPQHGAHCRLGDGKGGFGPVITSPFYSLAGGNVVADFDRDGLDDVAFAAWDDTIHVHLSLGDGSFQPALLQPLRVQGRHLAAGDINFDGIPDLVVSYCCEFFLVPLIGVGDGTFVPQPESYVGHMAAVPVLADFSLDGLPDVLCGYEVGSNVYGYLEGLPGGAFAPIRTIPSTFIQHSEYVVKTADVNADGFLDILAGHLSAWNWKDGLGLLLGSGPAAWQPEASVPSGYGGPTSSFAVADFDDDGKLDLALQDASAFNVFVRRGNGDGTFEPDEVGWPTGPGVQYPFQVDSADFDEDGLPDLVFEGQEQILSGSPARTVVVLNRSGNRPPVAVAGADRNVECSALSGALVRLDGSASSDPDSTPTVSDIVSYEWYEDEGKPTRRLLATGVTADVPLALGGHEITLVVTDTRGETATDQVIASVVDTTPPVLIARALPDSLWPPNHKLVRVDAEVEASDVCDPAPVLRLLAATSSEPDDALGAGDGHTTGDIRQADIGTADASVLLRAERAGTGPGRRYELIYSLTDSSGNATTSTVVVTVPHDRGR